jgi:hypothetical protein
MLAALVAASNTDWGPLQTAAQSYGMCAHQAAGKWVTSAMGTEAIVEKAMASCAAEQQKLKAVTRETLAPLAPSKAELEASVERQYKQQSTKLHDMLFASLKKYRGR